MGERSIVYGHIRTLGNSSAEFNRAALGRFSYDEVYPFPNIFRHEDGLRYQAPSIFIGGTFKELEADWPTWMNRFAALLSTLQAVEANVILDCWFGRFAWTLQPQVVVLNGHWESAEALVGQPWFITAAPDNEAELEHFYDEHLKDALTVRRHLAPEDWPHN